MTIFSSIIMLKIKLIENTTFKISIGLFLSVIIYYVNNFANILGKVEKIPLSLSVFVPIIILTLINILMINRINENNLIFIFLFYILQFLLHKCIFYRRV